MEASTGSKVLRWVDLRPVIVACGILATLLWQFSAPVLGNRPCGLIIPHEHILLGQADANDLERHLATEARCTAGKRDAPDEHASEPQGSKKDHILQVIRFNGSKTNYLTILHHVIADLPTVVVVQPSQPLYSQLEQICLLGQSVSRPPPKPPPEAA
jgi:hypothetical protein